jgi:thiol-disulfide isomerase/thioredoxin
LPSKIDEVHKKFGPKGFTVLAINIKENRSTVATWVKENNVTTTVLLDIDGKVTSAYRVTGTPTVVLIDRNGRMVGRAVGQRDWTGERGTKLIEALLARPKG